MRIATWSLIVATLALAPSIAAAQAQGRSRRYSPSRPTVSPYLNLLRRDGGPVTNYYTQVRPLQQQQALNQRQELLNQQQQQGLARMQEGLLEIRQPQASPTGTGGDFMNFSHFYMFARPSAPRR